MRGLTRLATAILLASSVSGFSTAQAVTILDTVPAAGTGTVIFGNFGPNALQDPLGQSFTLTQATNNLMVGARVRDFNRAGAPTFDLTFSVIEGAGTNGTVLGSSTFTLADGFWGVHTVDFSFLGTLLAGTYTAVFSNGAAQRGALDTTVGDADPNSLSFNSEGVFEINPDGRDFVVRVTGDFVSDPIPVPEPGTLALLLGGLIGVAGLRRRQGVHMSKARIFGQP